MRYFYHPESDSLWTEENENAHIHTDGLIEELSYEQYTQLKKELTNMVAIQGTFDARQHEPKQVGGGHPVGNKFPAVISHTECVPSKSGSGGMFVVTFQTQFGEIPFRYNLWYEGENSAKVIAIAHGQLSALCHATGIFQLDFANEGAALRNARCAIDVGYQKGQEPTPEKPEGGYTEIKKIYDAAGNEPGKAPAQPQTTRWGGNEQPAQQQPQPNPPQAGWAQGPQMQQEPQPQQQQPQPQGGWGQPAAQQGAQAAPPWKKQ